MFPPKEHPSSRTRAFFKDTGFSPNNKARAANVFNEVAPKG